MHPHSKHPSLFLTPRSPWGRLPVKRTLHNHMRASEDSRELPEEDKDGRWQGKIESTGETHGKPETSIEVGVKTNSKFRETGRQSDFLGEGRTGYDAHQAELEKQRAREHAQKAAQDAQAKKAAEAAQKPKQPSKWKWTAPSASAQGVPGL